VRFKLLLLVLQSPAARYLLLNLCRHPAACLGSVFVFLLALVIGLAVWPGVLDKKS
jgi:hypothetical protein